MINKKLIKIIGLAATILGAGTALATDWVNEKKMDEKISEGIDEAFAKKFKEHEES